jgi:adenylate cyclase class IV
MSNEPTKAQLEYTKLLAEIQKLSLESQQMEHNIYFQQTQRDLSRREHAYSYMLGSVDVMSLKYLNADIREWRDDNRTDRLVVSISSPGGV